MVCFFIKLLICSLKFNFESIVIPSSVTDKTDFVVISPICSVCKPVFPRIMNWKFSEFAFIELFTNHSYTFYVSCIRLLNMLSKFIPREQRLLSSTKNQISHFAEKKNKPLIKILKSKRLSIEPCGIPFTIFF